MAYPRSLDSPPAPPPVAEPLPGVAPPEGEPEPFWLTVAATLYSSSCPGCCIRGPRSDPEVRDQWCFKTACDGCRVPGCDPKPPRPTLQIRLRRADPWQHCQELLYWQKSFVSCKGHRHHEKRHWFLWAFLPTTLWERRVVLTPTSSAEGWPSGVVVLAMHPTVPDRNSFFVQRLEPAPWSPRPSLDEQLAPVDAEDLEEFGCPPPPPRQLVGLHFVGTSMGGRRAEEVSGVEVEWSSESSCYKRC
jgi:hypothetical protein